MGIETGIGVPTAHPLVSLRDAAPAAPSAPPAQPLPGRSAITLLHEEEEVEMVRLTARDLHVLDWLGVVRLTNMQGLRWILGGFNGERGPVTVRKAQRWAARMEEIGRVQRGQLSTVGGSLIWPAFDESGRSAPDLFRQTTRHEISVSLAAARFYADGWAWHPDRLVAKKGDHQGDGVAIYSDAEGSVAHVIEVELTPKHRPRYVQIFRAFGRRIDEGDVSGVVYLCTAESARAVRAALADPLIGPRVAEHVVVVDAFERMGSWDEDTLPEWMPALRASLGDELLEEPADMAGPSSLWIDAGGSRVE